MEDFLYVQNAAVGEMLEELESKEVEVVDMEECEQESLEVDQGKNR